MCWNVSQPNIAENRHFFFRVKIAKKEENVVVLFCFQINWQVIFIFLESYLKDRLVHHSVFPLPCSSSTINAFLKAFPIKHCTVFMQQCGKTNRKKTQS